LVPIESGASRPFQNGLDHPNWMSHCHYIQFLRTDTDTSAIPNRYIFDKTYLMPTAPSKNDSDDDSEAEKSVWHTNYEKVRKVIVGMSRALLEGAWREARPNLK
jgi:hypothetical protein